MNRPADDAEAPDWDETRRRELARFLRVRRESIAPRDAGLASLGRRRTPGLRREEVALLADIGTAWYTRLETARQVTPSTATLLAIARALQLTVVETEYLFALAGLPVPAFSQPSELTIPEPIEQLVPSIQSFGAIVWDSYMTALRWNAVADAMCNYSSATNPLQRNVIIRYLTGKDSLRRYAGQDYDNILRAVVGIFRKSFVTRKPTPFAQEVFAVANGFPAFRRLWDDHFIAEDLITGASGFLERHHPVLGTYAVITSNLRLFRRDDFFMRILAPADEASAEKLKRMQSMGTPSSRDTTIP
jgi:transcriptional regulator with XRE-family HTH domain